MAARLGGSNSRSNSADVSIYCGPATKMIRAAASFLQALLIPPALGAGFDPVVSDAKSNPAIGTSAPQNTFNNAGADRGNTPPDATDSKAIQPALQHRGWRRCSAQY